MSLTQEDFDKPCVRCGGARAAMALAADVHNMHSPLWPVCMLCSRGPAREMVREMLAALLVVLWASAHVESRQLWRMRIDAANVTRGTMCRNGNRASISSDGRHRINSIAGARNPRVDVSEYVLTHALNDG